MIRNHARAATMARSIVTILLVAGGIHAAFGDDEKAKAPTPEDTVRAAEYARAQALLKADTTALGKLVAPEFVEISRLGQVRTRWDNLHDIATGELKLATVRYDSLTVRIYGEVAVLQGIADNTGSFRGFPFGGKIRYTRVFVRRDGRWQAVAMQQTPMPASQ